MNHDDSYLEDDAEARPLGSLVDEAIGEPEALSLDKLGAMNPEDREAYWFKHYYRGDDTPQLTFRAVLMGSVLGMVMAMSNLYIGLKTGWGFGVAITACILSSGTMLMSSRISSIVLLWSSG